MVSNESMKPRGGIVGRIRASCARRPDRLATVGNSHCRFPTLTVGDLFRHVDLVAAGFLDLGVRPGDKVGMVSENHDLWLIVDLALLSIGAVTVPRGGDASTAEICFCLAHAECRLAIFDTQAVLDRVRTELPRLEHTFVMRETNADSPHSLDRLMERGREFLRTREGELRARQDLPSAADLATIVYTSGTTGNPKGVMLTHGNILHNVEAVPHILQFHEGMRFVSFLPTWHTFERTIEYIVLDAGLELHYSSKRTLKADVAKVRPHFLVGVPRVWETFYQGVMGAMEKLPPAKRRFIDWALSGSREFHRLGRLARGVALKPPARVHRPPLVERLGLRLAQAIVLLPEIVARRLVYSKLVAALGGELTITISGGGPLPKDVDEFFVRAGIPFLNGYGLTETAPVVCVRVPERNVLGSIGLPLPETEVRIVDEQGRIQPPEARGVIQIRGPQVMQGYYRNPRATKDCLTADGWFDSGDTGMLSTDGDVVITGRAKETIVLTGGENVEPENIETALLASPLIQDVVVVGHAQKALGALIIPNFEVVRSRVSNLNGQPEQLVAHPEVDRVLRVEVSRIICAEKGFRVFERVSRIAYLPRPFSVEDGTLTATLKKKRRVIEERYSVAIEALFTAD